MKIRITSRNTLSGLLLAGLTLAMQAKEVSATGWADGANGNINIGKVGIMPGTADVPGARLHVQVTATSAEIPAIIGEANGTATNKGAILKLNVNNGAGYPAFLINNNTNGTVASISANGLTTLKGSLVVNYQSDQIQLQSYNVAGKTWRMGTYIGATGANRDFTLWESDLGNAVTVKQANGYVGIGTVGPGSPLQVHSTNYKNIRLSTANANSDVSISGRPTVDGNMVFNSFGQSSTAGNGGFRWTNGDPDVNTSGPELMRLYDAGNLTNLFLRGTTGAALRFFEGTTERVTLRSDATPGDLSIQTGGTATAGPAERFRVRGTGDIGIGTPDPQRPVHLYRSGQPSYFLAERQTDNAEVGIELRTRVGSSTIPGTTNFYMWVDELTNDFKMEWAGTNLTGESDGTPRLMLPGKSKDIFACMSGGNFVIGNTAADPANRLLVDGNTKIKGVLDAQSIRTSKWNISTPDYVFEKGYDLKSLDKVESFVTKNKHLPEVPSAKELNEKGMDIAEMNLTLLKKVEELTLHAIRQEKELKRQAAEIQGMKAAQK